MRRPLASTLFAVLLAGCAAAAAGPPAVHWGVDECSHCHMILSEPRFAAVARSGADEVRFDDLGCLLDWSRAQRTVSAATPWQVWVHDANGERWLAAPSAFFVHTGTHTPMGSGILAFADEAAARAGAGSSAIQRFTDLVKSTTSTPGESQ